MKVVVLLAMATTCFTTIQTAANNWNDLPHSPPLSTDLQHFKFRTRNVNGRNVAALSFKLDPERGRRSILIPDDEGLLRPFPLTHHLRHHHRFLSPFEDEEKFALNASLDWGSPSVTVPQEGSGSESRVSKKGEMLQQMDVSLSELERALETERRLEELESASLRLHKKERKREKRRRGKKGKGRKGRKKKKQNRKGKKNKNKRKSGVKIFGQEACQFKILRKCAKKLGLLQGRSYDNATDPVKCDQRRVFLDCVEIRRHLKPCKQRSRVRGNLPGLRSWIKQFFWTSSSCILNESMKGK